MSRLLCLLALWVTWIAQATPDEAPLIRVGDVWQYFKAAADPQGVPLGWTRNGYNGGPDWLSGRSGIGTWVGGRDAENVFLIDRNYNYVAVCFRREFQVTDLEAIRWLTLRLDYQEGFVAYLNGREFLRVGIPGNVGEPVPVTTLAATRFPVRPVEFRLGPEALALLQPGTNTLALQVHTDRLGPGFPFSTSTGDLLCLAELLANFSRGPYVQSVATNSACVLWNTPVPANGYVEFGTTPAYGRTATTGPAALHHEVRLSDLEPDTLYHYRVVVGDGTNTVTSAPAAFRTFKLAGDLSFCLMGDTGSGADPQYVVAELIRARQPDLVIHCGDIVYSSFDPYRTDTRCLSVYGPHMRSTPYFFTVGNHDMYYDLGTSYHDAFCLPTNDVPAEAHRIERTRPESYYSFDHGDAHFVCLYNPMLSYYDFRAGTAQYDWLERDLEASTKKWKFIFQHIPIHTSGPHIYDEANFNGTNDVEDLRRSLLPLAQRYGVNAVFCGHDHLFERFVPDQGVHAVVTGAGGTTALYGLTLLDPLSAKVYSTHHFTSARIRGDTLTIEAIGTNGFTFDTFSIQRAPPPPREYAADWVALTFPDVGIPDGDGNLTGQRWPFPETSGDPLQSFSGTFANLGRLRVSTDSTNLFLGLERVMLPPGAEALLFLEVPGLPGVDSLQALGNGIYDPSQQGADGLDFLKNLRFQNFHPSVACVLGDEFSDGTFRDFARTGGTFVGGEGVFRLDPTFTAVPGARVQQFNRNPQFGPALGEANADFMVVGIPVTSLGDLQPEQTLRVAVIAARLPATTNELVREIDTGWIAAQVSGSGTNTVVVEALAVRLPPDADPDRDGLLTSVEERLGTNPKQADTDADGLGDGWEVAHQLNPLSPEGGDGAAGDPDGDGLSNLDEQRFGTDPKQADSGLRLSLRKTPGDAVRLSWLRLANTVCAVEAASTPQGPFTRILEQPPGPPGETFTELAPTSDARYYRLQLLRPGAP